MEMKKIIRGMEIILLISCIVSSCSINTIKELLIALIVFACLDVIFHLLVIKPINDKQNLDNYNKELKEKREEINKIVNVMSTDCENGKYDNNEALKNHLKDLKEKLKDESYEFSKSDKLKKLNEN